MAGIVSKWGSRHITGIELGKVFPDSPVDLAGMQHGDVVVNIKQSEITPGNRVQIKLVLLTTIIIT